MGRIIDRKTGSPVLLTAWRWDELVKKAKAKEWHQSGIDTAILARRTGLSWFHARGNEPLAGFLSKTGVELLSTTSLGLGKVKRLCDVVEAALKQENKASVRGKGSPLAESFPPVAWDARGTLAEWEVPLDFPIRMIRLPMRILHFCRDRNAVVLADLLRLWDQQGAEEWASQRSIGRESMEGINAFMRALQTKDHTAARAFLPLDESGRGLCLRQAIRAHIKALKPRDRTILERRLLQGMSLVKSGALAGVTRERARQLESGFIRAIQEWVGWFAQGNEDELAYMEGSADWMAWIGRMDSRKDDLLLEAALAAM
jgi:Sigma-70, region 4